MIKLYFFVNFFESNFIKAFNILKKKITIQYLKSKYLIGINVRIKKIFKKINNTYL